MAAHHGRCERLAHVLATLVATFSISVGVGLEVFFDVRRDINLASAPTLLNGANFFALSGDCNVANGTCQYVDNTLDSTCGGPWSCAQGICNIILQTPRALVGVELDVVPLSCAFSELGTPETTVIDWLLASAIFLLLLWAVIAAVWASCRYQEREISRRGTALACVAIYGLLVVAKTLTISAYLYGNLKARRLQRAKGEETPAEAGATSLLWIFFSFFLLEGFWAAFELRELIDWKVLCPPTEEDIPLLPEDNGAVIVLRLNLEEAQRQLTQAKENLETMRVQDQEQKGQIQAAEEQLKDLRRKERQQVTDLQRLRHEFETFKERHSSQSLAAVLKKQEQLLQLLGNGTA